MAEPKTKPTDASVDAFIEAVADEEARRDCRTLVDIMSKAAGAEARMWGDAIIGFGTHRYRYASGREGEWPVVAFSPRKQSLSLYLTCDISASADLLAKLGKHKTGKGCLYIRRLADVDMGVLKKLVATAVREARKAAKKA